jgi:hypothetical protein
MKTLFAFILLSLFFQQDNDTRNILNGMSNTLLPFECTRSINTLVTPRKQLALASKSTINSINFYYYRDVALTIKEKEKRGDIRLLRKFTQPKFTLLAVTVNFILEGRTQWLITYDKQYQIVDTLVCGIHFLDRPDRLTLRQWRINENCEVQVSFVKLDNTDSQINDPHKWIYFEKPIEGQRTDTFYQITDDGHFKKLREVKYKPQLYTSQYLSKENLWNGTETPIQTN